MLRTHLAKYGVSVEWGKGLVGVTQDADAITLTLAKFEDGQQSDKTEKVTAEYFIGADGGKGIPEHLPLLASY